MIFVYRVTADGTTIYDDRVPADEGLYLVNPKLHLEDSAAGSFECDLVPGTFAYAACEGMTTTIRVYRDDEEIFEGRILTESFDFYNVRSIYCEGELAYLNDTFQPQRVYHDITLRQYISYIICTHNQKVPPEKRFCWRPGTSVTDPDALEFSCYISDPAGDTGYRYTQYNSTLDALNKIIETFGGHMIIDKSDGVRKLHFYSEYTNYPYNQKIEFGKNLLDYAKDVDYSKICSVVLPTGGVLVSSGQAKKGAEVDLTVADPSNYVPGTTRYALSHRTPPEFLNDVGNWQPADENYYSDYALFYGAEVWVEEFKTYYLTCRMRGAHREPGWNEYKGNYAIYSICREDGSVLKMKTVSVSEQAGYEDTVDLEIEMPAGARWIRISGLDFPEIPMRFYKAIEAEADLDEYVTVESVNDGSLYVTNQTLIDRYGWVEKQIQWDDIDNATDLLAQAQLYLSAGQFNEISYQITALDMKLLGVNCTALKIGDLIEAESPPHGLYPDPTIKFPVTALDIPLDEVENMTITLGYAKTPTLTQANNDLSDEMLARIAAIPSESKTLENAKRNAASLINNATSGYITIRQGGDGTDEIIISDSPDYLTASNVWRWNSGGLAHQPGYNSPTVHVAMTMDGSIVANAITSGQMTANRIRGGELVLGGIDNVDGKFILKNVDYDESTTPPTPVVWNGITMDRDGFQSFSKGYDYVDQKFVYHDVMIRDGQLKAGSWTEQDGFEEYGHLAMTYYADPGGGQQLMPLFDLNGPILQFNCTHLWITERQGDAAQAVPDTQGIDVVNDISVNSDGEVTHVSKIRINFVHGICTGYTQL